MIAKQTDIFRAVWKQPFRMPHDTEDRLALHAHGLHDTILTAAAHIEWRKRFMGSKAVKAVHGRAAPPKLDRLARRDMAVHRVDRYAKGLLDHLHAPANTDQRDAMAAGVRHQGVFRLVALGRVPAKARQIVAAGQQDSAWVRSPGEFFGHIAPVGHGNGKKPRFAQKPMPMLIEGVAPFTGRRINHHPLAEKDDRVSAVHARISTRLLAQSILRVFAADHWPNRASPAPITAGMRNSAARIAMCELTPP